MALEMPGCEVNSALAVSVRLRSRRTASWTNRNWWRFIGERRIIHRSPRRRAAARGHRVDHRRRARRSPACRRDRDRRDGRRAGARPAAAGPGARWPPVPRKSGTTSTRVAAGGDERVDRVARGRRHQLEEGEARPARAGRAARTRAATASNGAAQRGSRAPCANRTSARRHASRSSVAHQPAERGQRQQQVERARRRGDDPRRPVASRPRWPTTLFSSTKLMPSMMPPKTFRLTPPERAMQVGEGQRERRPSPGRRTDRARASRTGSAASAPPARCRRGGRCSATARASTSSSPAAPRRRRPPARACCAMRARRAAPRCARRRRRRRSSQRVTSTSRERPACRRAPTVACAAAVRATQPAVGVELEDAHVAQQACRARPSRR